MAADLIKQKINTAEYKPGHKLPSIQTLSAELNYNSETIIKAYKLLEAEHLIFSVPKSGYYVVKSSFTKRGQDFRIDMQKIAPPHSINPYKDYYHCMERAIDIYQQKLFEYSDPKGMPELISAIAKHLCNFRIFAREENIFVTNGAQQALYILGKMTFPNNGTKVLVEQPTYSVMLQGLKSNNIETIGVRRTHNGFDVDELETIFKTGNIKFFYIMPRFQNPTGFSLNQNQKREILELSEKYGVYIVEDDYLADLELNQNEDSMYALGEKKSIIHIRSFSKTLLPGLRLGACILPKSMHNDFILHKRSIDINTPIITQGALEIYIRSKMYKSHVQRVKRHYKEKMRLFATAFASYKTDKACFYIPATGLYIYLELNNILSETIVKRLMNRGILANTTKDCYLENYKQPEALRLSICTIEDPSIEKVASIIREELDKFL